LQDDIVPAWQVPVPSHLPAAVASPAAQLFVPQTVPAAYSWQPPLPSHEPLVLQLGASWSAHCASGSCPAGTLMQVPALPVIAHDMQLPVQVVAQQTLFAQWPDLQSPSAAQVAPGGLGPQLPLTQKLPLPVQSASAEQVVLHDPVVPQM
jgi:hypothetical protein